MSSVNSIRLFHSEHIWKILTLGDPLSEEFNCSIKQIDRFQERELPKAPFDAIFSFYRTEKKKEEPFTYYRRHLEIIFKLTQTESGEPGRRAALAFLKERVLSTLKKVDELYTQFQTAIQKIAVSANWRCFEEQNRTEEKGFLLSFAKKLIQGKETACQLAGVTPSFDQAYTAYLQKNLKVDSDEPFIYLSEYRKKHTNELEKISGILTKSLLTISSCAKKFQEISQNSHSDIFEKISPKSYIEKYPNRVIKIWEVFDGSILLPYSEIKKYEEVFSFYLSQVECEPFLSQKMSQLFESQKSLKTNLESISTLWNSACYELRSNENRTSTLERLYNWASSYTFETEFSSFLKREAGITPTISSLEGAIKALQTPLFIKTEDPNELETKTVDPDMVLKASFEEILLFLTKQEIRHDTTSDEERSYISNRKKLRAKTMRDIFAYAEDVFRQELEISHSEESKE